MPQQRAVATRMAVLRGAASVFEREGYAEATIAKILAEVGITKGAMYFHFPSKEKVAEAIVAEQVRWRDAEVDETALSPLQQLVDMSYRFVAALQRDLLLRASVRLALESRTFHTDDPSAYTEWMDSIETLLSAADAAGEVRDGVDLGHAAYVVTGSITGLQLTSEAMTGRADLPDRVHDMWSLLMPSIATPEAFDALDVRPPADRS